MKSGLFSALAALLLSSIPHAATADSNGNGMSDAWEKLFNGYELFPASVLPGDDADGDGVSNLAENIAGTDPFDGTPPTGFLQADVRYVSAVYTTPEGGGEPILLSPEAFVISWPTRYGKQYTLQASPDLSSGSWIAVGESEYGYGQQIEIATLPTYQDGTVADKFFWRVAVTDNDTDGDGFSDYDEWLKGTAIQVADCDDDGLPDDWEILYGLDPGDDGTNDPDQGPYGDLDGEGLSNIEEYWHGTNPNNSDTDADNLTDYEEIHYTSTDPSKPDTNSNGIPDGQEDRDRDGLTNLAELRIHHTDPRNSDTDHDTLRDGWEVSNGLDPLVYNSITDPDGDGLTNVQEQDLGLNPLDSDTDDNGTLDGAEDPDGDGLTNLAELNTHHTDPRKADTDDDGLSDLAEINTHLTDPTKHDTDADGMPDGWEIQHSLDAKSTSGNNGAAGDPDSDGLDNFHEWLNGSDPNNADTDGDGIDDLIEANQGSDPNDPTDGGNPPEDEIQEVNFKAYGDYASWRMEIRGDGPRDHRTMFVVTPAVGVPETGTIKLRRNNKYKVTLHHTGSKDDPRAPWYCWEALVDGKPWQQTFADYEPGRISGVEEIFTIGGGHWLVDNRDGLFTAHNHRTAADGGNAAAGLEATLLPMDLAVDSDNNGGLNPPQRDIAEDTREDYLSAQLPASENPGKYIRLSTGDYDNDGIPDFADGMDIHNGFGTEKCGRFVPMIADLSGVMAMTGARIKFEYTAASPSNVSLQTVANEPAKWSPGSGDLRLWKKDGNESRKIADIKNSGDFVTANTEYSTSELGVGEGGLLTLYVEAISKSSAAADKAVTIFVKSDSQAQWIEADKVRFTAIPRVLFVETDQVLTPLPGSKIRPAFEDGIDATGQPLGGTLDGTGSILTVGNYGPHPFADSDETKDRERLVVTYQTSADTYSACDESTILLVAQGLATAGSSAVVLLEENTQGEGEEVVPPPGNYPPEVNGPETWDDTFERILFEKYEEADPRVEDLERDAFELWGWTYGGQNYQWFSARDVWRDGTKIYVEDSLTAEDAADKYYAFLKRNLPTEGQGANITPILRYYGEVYDALGQDRAVIGQHMAKHWPLVESTAGMLESEYMFVSADFAIGGVLQIRRVRNMTFFTEGKTFAVPLIRRNWARGNITEQDTLVNSLGYTRNAGQGALKFTETIDGQAVNCIPDSIRPHWFLEMKDVRSLSATRQIRAEFAAAANESKRVCIIITGRTRRISAPLFDRVKAADGLLVRRNVNTDGYEFWDHWNNAGWEAIDKADLLQFLSNP